MLILLLVIKSSHYLLHGAITSRKTGFCSGLDSPLVPVLPFVPVREPRGPARASWALVPVRLGPFVPVLGTKRDQWASLLAHNHWSRFVTRPGTKGHPSVPVPATNRDQWLWARSEAHWSRFVPRTGKNGPRRTGTNAHEAPAGPLGSRTGTNASIGPGSWQNRD